MQGAEAAPAALDATATPAVTPPTATPEPERPWTQFGLAAGAVLAGVDSGVRLGVEGVGIGVDLEDAFELDTTTRTARIEGFWRFTKNKRHRFDLSWIDLSRDSSIVSERNLDLGGGIVIPIGSQVSTRLDINLIRAAYSYSFLQDDRVDLAVSGGFFVAPINYELRATGLADVDESFGITAPLPVVGFRFDFALTPRWFIVNDTNLFFLEFDGFRGSLANIVTSVEYRAWKHVALGVGVDSFDRGVERNRSTSIPGVNRLGSIEFDYTGLVLFLKTVF